MKAQHILLGAAGLFIAHRGYRLYKLVEAFDYSITGAKVQRSGVNATLQIAVTLKNPTNTIVGIDKIEGQMFSQNIGFARFTIPAFNFQPGETKINVNATIDSVKFLNTLESSLKAKKLPVITTKLRTFLRGLPLGIPSSIDTPVKDYLPGFLF